MYKIIFLFNIYSSNILNANEWELPCPRNDCFETNNIEWEYFDLDTGIPYYFQENGGQKNPNCWVKVTYRTRKSDDPPCEQEDCEIEILNILVSGSCFYEYIDNSSQPPRIYPPIMSFNQVNQVWNRAISIFLKGADIPCISPSIGNCITTSGYKSASCKEIKVVVNGNEINYIVESCGESFNSCCQQELTVCRDIYGKLSTKWVMLPNHIDNCYLNNDQNCKFTCEEYGDGGWFPPKINFFDLEDDQVLKKFNYSNNSLKYNTNNTKLFCTISNVLGEKLYSNEITNKNEIYLEGNHKIIFVNLYDGKSYQTLKFIQE